MFNMYRISACDCRCECGHEPDRESVSWVAYNLDSVVKLVFWDQAQCFASPLTMMSFLSSCRHNKIAAQSHLCQHCESPPQGSTHDHVYHSTPWRFKGKKFWHVLDIAYSWLFSCPWLYVIAIKLWVSSISILNSHWYWNLSHQWWL